MMRSVGISGVLAVGATFAVSTVWGQTESVETARANSLEEVVVTAEKRAADVQDVSIAIDVVNGEQLVSQGIADLQGLTAIAPDLNAVQNTLFTQFTIRGVGSQEIGELGDSAVTIGIDGEYITRPVALNATMFDVERIEVLRGPQGTLYGRNATAGALNIIANKPTNELGATASLGIGNYSAVRAQGALNVPVTDSLAFRGAVLSTQHDGYRDGGPAGDVDDQDVKAVRLGMRYAPNEVFSWYLAGEYNEIDQTAPAQYGVNIGSTVPVGTMPTDVTFSLPDDFDLPLAGFVKSKQHAVRTQLDAKLGFATISYVGGYRDADVDGYQPLNGYVPELYSFDNHFQIQNQSHEIRMHGETDTLFWQTGLYYGREDQDIARGLLLPAVRANFGGQSPYVNFFLRDTESVTQAVFAQATFSLTQALSFTGGVRYTEDEKNRRGSDAQPFAFTYPNHPTSFTQAGVTPLVGVPNHGDWNRTTWLVGADWKVAPDSLLYAKVSTGYKAGGFDNVAAYDAEDLKAYEVGSKNRFFGGTLQLNAAAFYYDYTNQQTTVYISTVVGNQVVNAGASEVSGVEVELDWLATAADRLKFTANYLDAEFKDLPTNANVVGSGPVPVNLAGNRPVQSPEWTLVLGYDHTWELGPLQLTAGLRSQYKSDYYLTAFNWRADKQEAYTISDATVTLAAADRQWDVAAYVHNIEDERILTYAAFTGDTINTYNFAFGTPRTYGLQANYRWGR